MEKLLLQVGELIQTKRLGEAFDLTSISGWTPDIDVKVNQFINDKQICGIAAESLHCSPQKYIITLSRNCVYHMLDESLKKEAYEVLNRAEHFLVMKGHSKDLSEYCREISSVFNKIVDARSEFLDFNQKILVTLIKNSGIELDLLVGRTLFTCQLDGEELVTDLIELHSKCLQNLLHN